MRSVKQLRKKAASRPRKKAKLYSTSEARKNFAEALETAQVDDAVIGFDRYGRTVAALVPVEAIYMLAGLAKRVPAEKRRAIEDGARDFIANVPNRLSEEVTPPPRVRARRRSGRA